MIPDLVNISEAKLHDRYGLSEMVFPKNPIIVEDRTYFDFLLMLARIKAENNFVTRIKTNTVYQVIEGLDLPNDKDHDILKDEIIRLRSPRAEKSGSNKHRFRLIKVYKEDEKLSYRDNHQ
jgi:hypothetical protein